MQYWNINFVLLSNVYCLMSIVFTTYADFMKKGIGMDCTLIKHIITYYFIVVSSYFPCNCMSK